MNTTQKSLATMIGWAVALIVVYVLIVNFAPIIISGFRQLNGM